MAKYIIKYACGHEGTVDLFGKSKTREYEIKRLEKGVCPECEARETAKENAAFAEERGLPELVGTERQVAWANTLRQANRALFRDEIQFLVANKVCGAYGLNLQFCHNVIFYNNDFDYATRAQAEDRVHRYGQEHEVNIYDICASGTIDSFIRENLLKKENLADAFRKNVEQIKKKRWRANDGKKIPKRKRA